MDPQISLRLHQTSSDFRNYTTWKEANGSDGFTPSRICRKEVEGGWKEGKRGEEEGGGRGGGGKENISEEGALVFSSRVWGSLPPE